MRHLVAETKLCCQYRFDDCTEWFNAYDVIQHHKAFIYILHRPLAFDEQIVTRKTKSFKDRSENKLKVSKVVALKIV